MDWTFGLGYLWELVSGGLKQILSRYRGPAVVFSCLLNYFYIMCLVCCLAETDLKNTKFSNHNYVQKLLIIAFVQ